MSDSVEESASDHEADTAVNVAEELASLKEIHSQLLSQHEGLRSEYQKQRAALVEQTDKLEKLQQLLQPTLEEYEKMRLNVDTEQRLRKDLMQYTSKVYEEKEKLKRQSMNLLKLSNIDFSTVDIDLDAPEAGAEAAGEKQDEWRQNLEAEASAKREELEQVTEERDELRDRLASDADQARADSEELRQTKESLQSHQVALQQIDEVSHQLQEKYDSLELQLEREKMKNRAAKDIASTAYSKQVALQRQSALLLQSGDFDSRLLEAAVELEQSTEQLEEESSRRQELEEKRKKYRL